jgi:predicted ATPase
VVLTGGPCCGKTTLLDNLELFGFQVVPEAARMIIEEQQQMDTDILPWKNNYDFQRQVIKTQLELENSFDSRVTFCDRGVFDTPAFCGCAKVQTPEIRNRLNPSRYDLVVIPELLPVFINDTSRKETPEQAREIHKAIIASYRRAGYNPLILPVLAKQERLDYLIHAFEERGVLS